MNLMTLFVKMAQKEDFFVILFVKLSFEHQVGLVKRCDDPLHLGVGV